MQLSFLTWAEAEAAIRRCPLVIVPIGSTEQHGPNGLIGTDALPSSTARTSCQVAKVVASVGP